jgi:hypothetical protein
MEGSSRLKNGSGQGLTTGRPTHEVELTEDPSGGERVGPTDCRHPLHENWIKGAVPCTQEKSQAGELGDYCGRKTKNVFWAHFYNRNAKMKL